MKTLLLLLIVASVSLAAVAIFKAKIDDRLELDLGNNIKRWDRTVNGKKQYVKNCLPTDTSVYCNKFVNEDGTAATPETIARVLDNGRLVIEKIAKHDNGAYSSGDQEVSSNLPRSNIQVIVD